MLAPSSPSLHLLVFLLVLWATTGLTILHLAVLGVRQSGRLFRRASKATTPEPEPEGEPLSLTFVVPVYNDGLTVGPTIESVLRQSVPPQRVLVVDDGSTDPTPEVLESFRARGVDVLRLPKNVGKTRALDIALRHVTTDLVAITDADSIVHPDYVREVARSFRDPELAAVGGAVESIPHTWVTAARQIEYMMTVKIDRDAETTMNALIVLPGVSSTYRTSVLREMGFEFDTIAEDFDMTFRLQRANRKITMNMAAKVYTSDPPTLGAYYRQLVRWYTDFWLVMRKHRAVLGKRVFGTVEVPMLVLNATAASVLYLVLPIYLLFTAPEEIPMFYLTGIAVDLALVVVGWRLYGRNDLWWAMLSRIPTRFLSRFAYVLAMGRVLVGKPGRAWDKLERRSTDEFLAQTAHVAPASAAVAPALACATSGALAAAPPAPAPPAPARRRVEDALGWGAAGALLAVGLFLTYLPVVGTIALVAAAFAMLGALVAMHVARASSASAAGQPASPLTR